MRWTLRWSYAHNHENFTSPLWPFFCYCCIPQSRRGQVVWVWNLKAKICDFWQRTFYSFEKIFDLNHQKHKIIWKKMMQECFEIKKQTLSDVYLINLMFFAFIGHRHLNISFFKKEQNCNSFTIFCHFLCIAQYCKHLRECVRNLDLRVQVHPGELWVSKQRVHIVLEASKSAGAKGDVPKICGFVHPLHPC